MCCPNNDDVPMISLLTIDRRNHNEISRRMVDLFGGNRKDINSFTGNFKRIHLQVRLLMKADSALANDIIGLF